MDSIEAQIVGLGLSMEKCFGVAHKGRRPSQGPIIDAITTDMVRPVIPSVSQSKSREPDTLRMFSEPDGKLTYIEGGGLKETKKEDEETRKGKEGDACKLANRCVSIEAPD